MKAEKFFVIGSNSFTGATFVDYLLARGCEVIGTSRSPEAASAFLPYKWPAQRPAGAQFKFAQLDLNDATEGLAAAVREFEPSYVVNFAAQSMVAKLALSRSMVSDQCGGQCEAARKNPAVPLS